MRASPLDADSDGVRALLRTAVPAGGKSWPPAMRVTVDLMLGSRFPMFAAWAPELRLVYNDACIDLLGERHPAALGQPLAQAFTDAWASVMPVFDASLAGEAALVEDLALEVAQHGQVERCYVTLSASPLREGGEVIGVVCMLTDTTARVLAEQQHRFQLKLGAVLRELLDPVDVMEVASALVGRHLAVGRAGYGEIDRDGLMVTVGRDWTDGKLASLAGETRALDSFGPALIERLRLGEMLQLDDTNADPLAVPYAPGYASIGARAMIVVPIIEAGRLAAIFYLHEAAPRDWTAREVALAEDVARQTREAVRRARVEETLRDETRILEVLHHTGQALASTLDGDMLLQAITDAGTQLSGAQFGAFFYSAQDERGENLLHYTLSGAPREAFEKFGKPRPTAIFHPTFHNDGIVRSDDITLDARYGQSPPHYGMPQGHLPVRSYLAVPVVARSGTVLGSLFFGHPEPAVFNERTERIVAGVAAQAAVALDNARLYEVARKSALERDALLQSERAARVEAERLSRMKDEFLAMLAHELRNPLAPISSSSALLGIQFRDEPRVRQASAIIARQVKHMSRLIDDLLDVSRVTRGLVTLQVDEVDLVEVVRSALDQTHPLIEEKSHRVEVDLPHGPVYMRGDATRLIQAIANILNNAAKYTPPAGTIRVVLALQDARARLQVRDNGSGMPPDLLPSVFELFTQGARTLARSQGGLGLGLALVKKLIELHGGEVSAHSDGVGLGSVLTIDLPCTRTMDPASPPASLHAAAAGAQAFRPLRVIVVDDNADGADSLAMLLRAQGHTVTVEYTGRGALRRAMREAPDAMVVDIGLPDMDGYQLASLLRAQPETRAAVLIAATGYGQERDRERAREAGFVQHMVKPVDIAALVRILQTAASAS
ncbi:GAF domain-containing protein [Massilia sp. CMS3.1]|uniref:hybrid sensor histidine kinase/response regulator n=1 Tax=Massilia sp. CMS3.1 TaxID=3373083 RepID=UPI003EE68CCD